MEESTGGQSSERPVEVDLRILSPSTEIQDGLSFPGLSAQTTVARLKELIRDSVPSRPAADRQRLIFQGRVLSSGDSTLAEVFGLDQVIGVLNSVAGPLLTSA